MGPADLCPAGSSSLDLHDAFELASGFDRHLDYPASIGCSGAPDLRLGDLGPLHEADRIGREVVVEERWILALKRGEPVEIEVRDIGFRADVAPPECERR